jgi:hypothetical protein
MYQNAYAKKKQKKENIEGAGASEATGPEDLMEDQFSDNELMDIE